ncbi:uncharacterized protein LOC132752742 [Ruditapes philippinarum]|uniref:uncharacterized protein LOC132752742 n=1 Tax=Ruditapes philippinarum TaxID=129788 RepID=UPI00295B1973|nr:uncharacterized protein LOC132752742 [Ruditapes philippinarum]XP_060599092.1 uncharacterized protein LOC132752742 [Ruditapes philippinarum]
MGLCVVYVAYVLVLVGSALAEPALDISKIKITDCNCQRCLYTQLGYAIHGTVSVTFGGSKVSCSDEAIITFGGSVIGWNYNCPISGSSSGIFEVSYNYGNLLCGTTFDRVLLHRCSGTPCSSFG